MRWLASGGLHKVIEIQSKNRSHLLEFHFNASKQREALEKFGRDNLGVKELNDWYSVKVKDVWNKFTFIRTEYGSLANALKALYPQHNWDPLRFKRVPRGFWNDENAQREALERVGREQLGVKELDDWYSVSIESVYNQLSFIRNHYNGSLYNALKSLYPHHDWNRDRFSVAPQGYWSDENIQRQALEKFGKELGVKELDDWYHVSSDKMYSTLTFIRNHYNGSLYNALKKLYPQHNWNRFRFTVVPRGHWSDANTHRDALERFGRDIGVEELDDWYAVSPLLVYRELSFVQKYGSLMNALKTLYPHHKWDPLLFTKVPHGFWQQPNTLQHYRNLFMDWKKLYGIRTVRDWYQLPPQQLRLFKRASMGLFGSKMKMLEEWFPDVLWHSNFTSEVELKGLLQHVISNASIKLYKSKHSRESKHSALIDGTSSLQINS